MRTSYPFLNIARAFGINYGDVLHYADWLAAGRPTPERCSNQQMEAVRRIIGDARHAMTPAFVQYAPFRQCIMDALAGLPLTILDTIKAIKQHNANVIQPHFVAAGPEPGEPVDLPGFGLSNFGA